MKRFASIAFGLIVSWPLYSQTPASVNKDIKATAQQRRDSLKRVFYSEPPYVLVSCYHNSQLVLWSADMTFFIIQAGQRQALRPVKGGVFLLPEVSVDSLALGLEYAGRTICLQWIQANWLTYGGNVTFGIIDHFRQQQRQYLRAQRNDADSLLEDTWPYYDMIRDKKIRRFVGNKKNRGIVYQILVPRVWGDPAVMTSYRVDNVRPN